MEVFAKGPDDVHACPATYHGDGKVEQGFWIKFDPSEKKNLSKLRALPWGGALMSSIKLDPPTVFSVTVWHVTAISKRPSPNGILCDTMRQGCTYYDAEGDPFDPENEANWDRGQQVGFRE
jgi:hypothetical protein